jgi:L-ribulokinase
VGGSSLDAHAGAVAAGIAPGVLVKVIGTSSVDLAVVKEEELPDRNVSHLFGLAQNAMLPGYLGLESGQCAFGDVFAWLKGLLAWAVEDREIADGLLARLEAAASRSDATEPVTALDWLNGRRYPSVDYGVRGAILGLSLGTTAPDVYRALVLAAAFGSRAVMDGVTGAGVDVREIVAVGGIAHKSPYIMQTLADALDRTISVCAAKQACALGAAMYAAVSAGLHPDLPAAQQAMGAGFARAYAPDPQRRERLKPLYQDYLRLAGFVNAWQR